MLHVLIAVAGVAIVSGGILWTILHTKNKNSNRSASGSGSNSGGGTSPHKQDTR